MTHQLAIAHAAALAVLVGGLSLTQDPEKRTEPARRAPRSAVGEIHRITKIHGKTVSTPRGEKLGTVEDAIVDVGSGTLGYLVVDFDSAIVPDGKLCAVPWTAFAEVTPTSSTSPDVLVLETDKEKLKTAPCFEKGQWPNMNDVAWATRVNSFFGQKNFWEERGMRPSAHEASGAPAKDPSNGGMSMERAGLDLRKASKVIGLNVHNLKDEKVGEIEELVVTPRKSHVTYAVLSAGGFLGVGEKLFAIPFHAFTFTPGTDTVTLDVDKERLKNAPGFEKNAWPTAPDETFTSDVHKYWEKREKPATRPSNRRDG